MHQGPVAEDLASDALLHYSEWEDAIENWQNPILHDNRLPSWYKVHVLIL